MHFIPLHPESASDLVPPRGIGGCCTGAAFPAGTLHFHPLLHLPAGMGPGFPSSQAKDRDHSIPGRSLPLLEPSGEGPEGQAETGTQRRVPRRLPREQGHQRGSRGTGLHHSPRVSPRGKQSPRSPPFSPVLAEAFLKRTLVFT